MRLRDHPEAADLLYEALNNDDLELAHEIAMKYNFAIRGEATKYDKTKYVYYSRFYDGEIKRYEDVRELSKALGGGLNSIRTRLANHSGTYWVKGKMTGYVIWQEKAGLSDKPLNIPKPMKQPVVNKRKKYTYYVRDTNGVVSEYKSVKVLAKVLGRDRNSIYQYFRNGDEFAWKQGPFKGMRMWRELT